MVDNLNELAELLMRRDGINRNEAENLISCTAREISDAIGAGDSLETLEDIVADFLGLEPDYLELFLI